MQPDSILWRRLDTPGHDVCRLVDRGDVWRIEGASVFRHETGLAALVYEVECDREWRTREGVVSGWVASRGVDIRVTRNPAGVWTLNGQSCPACRSASIWISDSRLLRISPNCAASHFQSGTL